MPINFLCFLLFADENPAAMQKSATLALFGGQEHRLSLICFAMLLLSALQ